VHNRYAATAVGPNCSTKRSSYMRAWRLQHAASAVTVTWHHPGLGDRIFMGQQNGT